MQIHSNVFEQMRAVTKHDELGLAAVIDDIDVVSNKHDGINAFGYIELEYILLLVGSAIPDSDANTRVCQPDP